jgi:tetratricopeptide (TPR) repeat protein
MASPLVVNDPRFQAGRKLVERGLSNEGGVEIFATLLEEVNTKYGNDSIEAAPAYYEYGNALHYAALSRVEENNNADNGDNDAEEETESSNKKTTPLVEVDDVDDEKKPAAVETKGDGDDDGDDVKDPSSPEDESDDDDLALALEMMESAFSILQLYEEEGLAARSANASSSRTTPEAGDGNASSSENNEKIRYLDWVQGQLPRALMGIGDVLSSLGRYADATDVYTRALERRKDQLEKTKTGTSTNSQSTPPSLELLKSNRLVCEAAIATAQALLNCPPDEDVITTETKTTLVSQQERVSFIEGYYWQSRDALQDVLLTLAELEARSKSTNTSSGVPAAVLDQTTKEDVSHIATWVMGVGEELAAIKEQEAASKDDIPTEPLKKRSKR